ANELFQYAIGELYGGRLGCQFCARQARGLLYSLIRTFLRERAHLLNCRIQLRINTGVTRIEPDGEMTVLTPRGCSWLNDLLSRMRGQIFTRRCEPKIWFRCCVADELFQENWSLEPPVPKQFRIERSDNERVETDFADFANLLMALFQKVNCMLCCCIFGCRSVIQLFLIAASSDPMVFYAGKFPGSAGGRSQMFHGQVETDVAIKLPVSWMARITFVRTPDLATGVGIACERRWPRWCITGSINGS